MMMRRLAECLIIPLTTEFPFVIHAALGLCSVFLVFRRCGERPNERVSTVGIGWVLLSSATSSFSGCISLPTAPLPRGLQ